MRERFYEPELGLNRKICLSSNESGLIRRKRTRCKAFMKVADHKIGSFLESKSCFWDLESLKAFKPCRASRFQYVVELCSVTQRRQPTYASIVR